MLTGSTFTMTFALFVNPGITWFIRFRYLWSSLLFFFFFGVQKGKELFCLVFPEENVSYKQKNLSQLYFLFYIGGRGKKITQSFRGIFSSTFWQIKKGIQESEYAFGFEYLDKSLPLNLGQKFLELLMSFIEFIS